MSAPRPPKCACSKRARLLEPHNTCQGRRFRCVHCKRWVPWCFGAHDSLPNHCDDCWADAQLTTEAPR